MISNGRPVFSRAAMICAASGWTFPLSLCNGAMTEISGSGFIGLTQIAAEINLVPAKKLPVIIGVAHPEIDDLAKIFGQRSRRHLRLIGFLHVNGVFAFSHVVARPEIKLVLRQVGPNVINQRLTRDAFFGLWQIEAENRGEAIMLRDQEDRLAFTESFFPLPSQHQGNLFPAAHAVQRIEMRGQVTTGENFGHFGKLKESASKIPDNQTGCEPAFDRPSVSLAPFLTDDREQCEQRLAHRRFGYRVFCLRFLSVYRS